MFASEWKRALIAICLAIVLGTLVAGCSDDDDSDNDNDGGNGDSSALNDSQINATDGMLNATIRRTTGGVPHITADNLESAGFGAGYAQATDNVCIIADQILQVRGERARFYGPGEDNINVINDFSIKALGLLNEADDEFDTLAAADRAMLRGFAAGYNKYVGETEAADFPGKCNNQPWVREITPQELYAYYELISLYGSGFLFLDGATFSATPPGVSAEPTMAITTDLAPSDRRMQARLATATRYRVKTDYTRYDMGSNGWGLGKELTENGRGVLLANPHYPYTGNRRFYQSHITVPDVYDVNGASLIGFVLPQIGFNENVAWTHTVSTARHFTLYQLNLKSGDDLTYIKDGEEKPITSQTFQIEVANGTPTPTTLERTFYYSEYGPMLNANAVSGGALPEWGETFGGERAAFTYRDAGAAANSAEVQVGVAQYLAMGRANSLAEFQRAYQPCGTVVFVNTMYADSEGNAFYVDGSATPNLSNATLSAVSDRAAANPAIAGLDEAGITLLDGSTSRDDWVQGQCNGLVSYAGYPKLRRDDYVQNSNDSYWATNLDAKLTDYSPLFGPTESILSPRTRMGLKMLTNPEDAGLSSVKPAGDDGQFTGQEVMDMLYSNRAYYPETLLEDLRSRCDAIGSDPVSLPDDGNDDTDDSARPVADGCSALAGWNGVYDAESTGAHVFRVFIGAYSPSYPEQFTVSFDPDNPATTPSTPPQAAADPAQDPMLQALARGLNALDSVNIAYDAALGTVQYQQQSAGVTPGGEPMTSGPSFPWHGTQNIEGGFNIVRPYTGRVDDGTRFPRVAPSDTLAGTGDLSAADGDGWQIAYGTSWHFGLGFTDAGPEAYGLISYSQSDDPSSVHFSDQDERYANKNYRRLLYSDQQIESDPNLVTETVTAQIDDD